MELLTTEIRERLIRNGVMRAKMEADNCPFDADFVPVVKLFTPDAGATWLLTEIDPDDPDLAFGLCDLGVGCPELGYVSLAELAGVRGCLGLPVERDLYFKPAKTLSAYADEAAVRGSIGT